MSSESPEQVINPPRGVARPQLDEPQSSSPLDQAPDYLLRSQPWVVLGWLFDQPGPQARMDRAGHQ